MTRLLLAAVLAVLVGYGLLEAYPLLSGPSLTIATPANGAAEPNGLVTVSGSIRRVVALTLDGAPILPEQDGSFSSTISLPAGSAILTLTASDRFGRSITKTRTVFVSSSSPLTNN